MEDVAAGPVSVAVNWGSVNSGVEILVGTSVVNGVSVEGASVVGTEESVSDIEVLDGIRVGVGVVRGTSVLVVGTETEAGLAEEVVGTTGAGVCEKSGTVSE
jgi:hypothetical protein